MIHEMPQTFVMQIQSHLYPMWRVLHGYFVIMTREVLWLPFCIVWQTVFIASTTFAIDFTLPCFVCSDTLAGSRESPPHVIRTAIV
jgi:hypothetical protein